jgi:nucleoside-diphosphate-sugar epimerase
MQRKNLVLGKGLLGTDLANALRERGEEVVVLSRGDGHDLRAAEQYEDKFVWADRVWFVAWDVGVWKQATDPGYQAKILDSNLKLCASIFGLLQRTQKPFLFVSSHVSPDMTVLGVGKRVGEMYSRILGGHVARLWNVYGWETPGEKSHLIPDLVWKGMQGGIMLMSSGEETRQFLYVRDCSEALIHQMEIGQKDADVTSWESVSVKDMAETIAAKLGVTVTRGENPGRPALHEPKVRLEGWTPRFSLAQGLDALIEEGKRWAAAR